MHIDLELAYNIIHPWVRPVRSEELKTNIVVLFEDHIVW